MAKIEVKKMTHTNSDPEYAEIDSVYYNLEDIGTSDSFSITSNEKAVSEQKTVQDKDTTINIERKAKSARQKLFDEFLVEAIDQALTSLGEPVKNAVYLHLEDDFHISKDEIPDRIEEFSDILHKIFGIGAGRLEIKFMKNLHAKIQVKVQWPEYEWPFSKWIVMGMSFREYVYEMRKKFETSR